LHGLPTLGLEEGRSTSKVHRGGGHTPWKGGLRRGKQAVESLANGSPEVKSVKNDLEVVPPSKPTAIDDKGEAITLRD
jgi:hypothetical protein